MKNQLTPYRPKPTIKEQIKYRLAMWAWYLGLKEFKD